MFCVVSNGELWKLCEQKHSGHYLADGTLLLQKWLLTLCVCVCVCVRVFSRSVVSDSLGPYEPVACHGQVPLSMGFSKQEYRSGLPFPTPGDLPHPGIEHKSLASPTLAGRFFIILR